MDAREERGLVIAARHRIFRNGVRWIVPSQTLANKKYSVSPDRNAPYCNCPDHAETGKVCKHIHAVRFVIEREVSEDGCITETITVQSTRKTYPQNWRSYNRAQTQEKARFQSLLRDLCAGIAFEQPVGRGRPRIPLDDAIFSAIFKVYSTVSGRRFMCDLRDAQDKGHIRRAPSYNSIFNVFESPNTTPILKHLLTESAMPLKPLESHFSCDGSGFSGSRFDRWFDQKYGGAQSRRAWVKAHIMSGARTNVITAAELHNTNTHDSPQLPTLLANTVQRFNVQEVSADLGYISENNLQVITDAGAWPLIPFKSNATERRGGLWGKMFHYYRFNREEFEQRYHLRSNVESTFSMVKAKFGDSVRSKTDVAMINEVLAKFVAHNICCVLQSMVEFGIEAIFWAEDSVAQKRAAE